MEVVVFAVYALVMCGVFAWCFNDLCDHVDVLHARICILETSIRNSVKKEQ